VLEALAKLPVGFLEVGKLSILVFRGHESSTLIWVAYKPAQSGAVPAVSFPLR
jgi:hypothetical protein